MARAWGFWTRGKLGILRDYLDAFSTASQSAGERLYFDLFAGEPDNVDRITGEPVEGSPWVALSINDPRFTKLRFFELDRPQELAERLRTDFPNRDFRVIGGDCNQTVHTALAELQPLSWAPAFAFIDPNGPDVSWTTLEALASFKANRRNKVEMWMLFPEPMFVRFLRTDGGEVDVDHERRITDMYGTHEWLHIYRARLEGSLTPAEARTEYVNLMRWRLQSVLGYIWTHTLEVHTEQDRPIYHLIFASDHDAGDRIMRHLYGRALDEFPKMRQQAVDQRKGTMRLFDDDALESEPMEYRYEPPWPPYGSETIDHPTG